jgi:putative NIF3 family GTP cyclohydrolase 1 type 2
MDSHPEIGHNSQTLKDLGMKNLKPYEIEGANWGWMGKFSKAKSLNSIVKKCKKMFMREVSVYDFGNDKVKTVVSVSGGGAPRGIDMQRLVEEDVDLYITGTPRESSREMFREIGCSMIVGGHYATERIGVLALMDKVKKEFRGKVKTEFIELWNEV